MHRKGNFSLPATAHGACQIQHVAYSAYGYPIALVLSHASTRMLQSTVFAVRVLHQGVVSACKRRVLVQAPCHFAWRMGVTGRGTHSLYMSKKSFCRGIGRRVIVPQVGGKKGVQRQEAHGQTRVSARTGQVWGHFEGGALQVCNAAATSSRSPRLQPTRRHTRARGRSHLGRPHLGACENSKHGSCAHSTTAVSMRTCVGGVLRRHALATRLRVAHPEILKAKIDQSQKNKISAGLAVAGGEKSKKEGSTVEPSRRASCCVPAASASPPKGEMEKKHLTFSKRTIRQHGGVDPSIRSLKKDALASSKQGFTLADPHDAVHCYMAAERMEREAEKREKADAAWLRKEEETRQGNERRMLNKSLAILLDEFKDEWKHKRTLVDEEITHIQQAVRERADAQRHFLEKKYGKERIPSVKYSTFTRDMIKQAMAPIP